MERIVLVIKCRKMLRYASLASSWLFHIVHKMHIVTLVHRNQDGWSFSRPQPRKEITIYFNMFVNPLPAGYCHESWHVWHGHSSWSTAHCKDQLLPYMAKQPLATPYKRIALRMFTVSPAPNTRLPMISRLIRGLIGRIACILRTGTHHIIEAAPKYRDGSSLNRPNHLWLAHIAWHPSMLKKSNLKELSCPPPAYSCLLWFCSL